MLASEKEVSSYLIFIIIWVLHINLLNVINLTWASPYALTTSTTCKYKLVLDITFSPRSFLNTGHNRIYFVVSAHS